MRTETITRDIYSFEELSDDAKEKARDWYREGIDLAWSDESRESIQAFCAAFNVRLTDWEIGPHCAYHYRTDATNANFRGLKLRDVNRDNMPTGYCLDCDLWMTFYDSFKKTGDALEAFRDALDAGFAAWQRDMEYQLSDEAVDESIQINGYEFTESGRLA